MGITYTWRAPFPALNPWAFFYSSLVSQPGPHLQNGSTFCCTATCMFNSCIFNMLDQNRVGFPGILNIPPTSATLSSFVRVKRGTTNTENPINDHFGELHFPLLAVSYVAIEFVFEKVISADLTLT